MDELDFDGFDWDDGNREKCQKHRMSIFEIQTLLLGAPVVIDDVEHSSEEVRLKAVDRLPDGRGAMVVFTLRHHEGRRLVRPISARYMHDKEIARYEQTVADADDR